MSCNVAFSSANLFLSDSFLTYVSKPVTLAKLTTRACGLSSGNSARHKFKVPNKFTLIVA